MRKIEGKWFNVNANNKKDGIEGIVEFKENKINVNFKNENIFAGSTYRAKINDKYFTIWFNRHFFNGNGNAALAIESAEKIDLSIEKTVIKEIILNVPNLEYWLGGDEIKEIDGYLYPRDIIEVQENKIYIQTYLYEELSGVAQTKSMINVILDEPISIGKAEEYISCILKFFAILIGRIDHLEEIYLKLDNVEEYVTYYTTMNNSHMTQYDIPIISTRTSYKYLSNDIKFYYSKWCEFYQSYKIVIDHYFKLHATLPLTIEDMFLAWCNIYDGYWIHGNEIDRKSKKFEKEVKKLLKEEEIYDLFTKLFSEYNLKFEPWKVAQKIKKEIETEKSLGEVLKVIFKDNYDLISKNINDMKCGNEEINEETIYGYINRTRNFYTHLKQDTSKILNYNQIIESNKLFHCTFIIILLKQIGFEGDELKRAVKNDWIISFHII